MPNTQFFDFVVNLVKLGGLGVGALIFVLAFILLFRNQAASSDMAAFRLSFLKWGFFFAIFALVASTATDFIKLMRPAGAVRLGVTISPDFADAKLPPPDLVLMPAGTRLAPNTSTEVTGDATLAIQVRGIVESVKGLAQSSQSLLETNEKLTNALDKSSQVVQTVNASPAPPSAASAAIQQLPVLRPEELVAMKATQSQIAQGLSSGDFRAVAKDTVALHAITASAEGLKK